MRGHSRRLGHTLPRGSKSIATRLPASLTRGLNLVVTMCTPVVLTPSRTLSRLPYVTQGSESRTVTASGAADARDRARSAVAGLFEATPTDELGPSWTAISDDEWHVLESFAIRGRRIVVLCSREQTATRALTVRERQVAALASAGESNKAIGYRLGISASTVGVLLSRASSKLGIASRAELRGVFEQARAQDE